MKASLQHAQKSSPDPKIFQNDLFTASEHPGGSFIGLVYHYLNQGFELEEGFLQMNFFRVCREDGQISSIQDWSG